MSEFAPLPGLEHEDVVVNGRRLHVASVGAGPVLLLLHGWPEFWATWLPLMRRLQGRFRLVAPDLYGFGRSDKPEGWRDDADGDMHAVDMAAIVDALGLEAPLVVGHDVGAFVAQRLAARFPEKVRALHFFDCPTPAIGRRWVEKGMVNEIWYQSFHRLDLAEKLVGHDRATCRLYFEHFLTHWCHRKDAFADALDLWVDNFMAPGALTGGFNWYRSMNARRVRAIAGETEETGRIPHRTRVLWGRHDPICRAAWADVLPEVFSDLSVGFAEEAGHFVHVEWPDLAAADIAEFVSAL